MEDYKWELGTSFSIDRDASGALTKKPAQECIGQGFSEIRLARSLSISWSATEAKIP
jgi:hypothetical protein